MKSQGPRSTYRETSLMVSHLFPINFLAESKWDTSCIRTSTLFVLDKI
jgi:hypothetical protein